MRDIFINEIILLLFFFHECDSCLHRIVFIICGIEHLCKQATVISSERKRWSSYKFARKAKNIRTSHCEKKSNSNQFYLKRHRRFFCFSSSIENSLLKIKLFIREVDNPT